MVAGGLDDPNLRALVEAANRLMIDVADLRIGSGESPSFDWNIDSGVLTVQGSQVEATAAFIRYDVFTSLQDRRMEVSARSSAWFHAVAGWMWANPAIRIFNRHLTQATAYKPSALIAARRAGLRIPETLVSNESASIEKQVQNRIAKPVAGGGYCYLLEEALSNVGIRGGKLAAPAIVQERLAAPEIRIYVVGRREFSFHVKSESLDYRVRQDVELHLMDSVPVELARLRALMAELRLDFGAADFKTNSRGELTFMELNTSPMFARFNEVADGRLAEAIIQELIC